MKKGIYFHSLETTQDSIRLHSVLNSRQKSQYVIHLKFHMLRSYHTLEISSFACERKCMNFFRFLT